MVWITHTIEINAAGISQIGLDNERRLNITPPSTRGRKSRHSESSMRIRLSNLGHGDAGVQQKARRSSPTNRLQPRTSIHVETPEESSHQTIKMNGAARDSELEVSRNTRDKESHDCRAQGNTTEDGDDQNRQSCEGSCWR